MWAAEVAAEISLQVHRRSEELRVSEAADLPYKPDTTTNAQRRSDVEAMR